MKRALLALALLACSRREATPVVVVDASPVVPATDVVDPKPQRYTASIVRFGKRGLSECTDLSVVVITDAGPLKANPAEVMAMRAKDKKDSLGDGTCAEQFGDRTVLATCEGFDTVQDAGLDARLEVVTSHYDFSRVGLSDEAMRECLESGGKWRALPKDSIEFRKARREHALKNLQRASEELPR